MLRLVVEGRGDGSDLISICLKIMKLIDNRNFVKIFWGFFMINLGYIFKKFIITELSGLFQFWSSVHQLSGTNR